MRRQDTVKGTIILDRYLPSSSSAVDILVDCHMLCDTSLFCRHCSPLIRQQRRCNAETGNIPMQARAAQPLRRSPELLECYSPRRARMCYMATHGRGGWKPLVFASSPYRHPLWPSDKPLSGGRQTVAVSNYQAQSWTCTDQYDNHTVPLASRSGKHSIPPIEPTYRTSATTDIQAMHRTTYCMETSCSISYAASPQGTTCCEQAVVVKTR